MSIAVPADGALRASVIVPVRNRAVLLAALLNALNNQTERRFEVIVVDDGSEDGADTIAASAVVAGRPVRTLQSGGVGAVAARRLGVEHARAPVLVFTDSDCLPVSRWLEHGLRAIDDGADLVNGLTLPLRPLNPMERSVSSATEGLYPTANMFFRRSALEAVGGFDATAGPRLGFRHTDRVRDTGFGEDTMVAWALIRAGYRVRHVPEAEVRHHVFPANVREWLNRGWETGAFPALVAEVPELRRTIMRRRIFFGDRSRLPFYLTLAATASRRRWPAIVALGWWVGVRFREMKEMPDPWTHKLPYLPAEMLLDAVSGTAMLVGSARARTLVL